MNINVIKHHQFYASPQKHLEQEEECRLLQNIYHREISISSFIIPLMEHPSELKRSLGLIDSTMIVAGSMIGSGIFIVTPEIARNVGGSGWVMLAWVIAGIVTIVAALRYGELAGMMPAAGGQYIYLRERCNSLTGFVYGWTLFMVIQTATIAAVAVGFAKFTSVFIPSLSYDNILFEWGFFHLRAAQLFAIGMIV